MEKIIVNGGGISWCWYTEYEIERIEEGRAIGKKVWSDRFHRFDENQGAGNHPKTDWDYRHSAAEPQGWKLTDSNPEFWMKGWMSNCKSQNVDPEKYSGFVMVTNRTTDEELLILFPKDQM